MKVYRITSPKWAHDISGNGAKQYGGRWNSVGLPMTYTSENISLCMLEVLVNASRHQLHQTFCLIELEIPEDIISISEKELPLDWNTYPNGTSTTTIGDKWLQGFNSLALKVPSSINKFEHNLLLNPLHSHYNRVKIAASSEFSFQQRLLAL